ncbi:Cyclin-T1 [Oryzias melastigma]|uniref:Cyclin-T1 n=1 Tax=Oryzias melastigma TaxID=30732 RepID=A0A834BV35_ORYME|nr:Cyclin-T1 [Oryzias melastigma]
MAEVVELQKLKLAELRQECDARGLETKGNKGELIARLQAYLEEHEEDVDVDEVLAEDTPDFTKVESSNNIKEDNHTETIAIPPSEDKKVVKISPPSSAGDKLQKRAERFNMPASAESKKAMRAARFGSSTTSNPTSGLVANSKAAVNVDQLKKRAERFGMNVSSISQKVRKLRSKCSILLKKTEKLKKRKERFGILTSASPGGADDVEEIDNNPSRRAGLDPDKELSYRQQAANLIQDMGQRLNVSQLTINTAIVYMHRFYMIQSFTRFHRNVISPAALFLAAKVEEQPRKLEHVIKVAHACLNPQEPSPDVRSDAYLTQAQDLVILESIILQTLAFEITIDHPHTHVVKCTQLVRASKDLAQTSYFMATNSLHLTTFCLQYSPPVVACVCIHLACKWSNWEIPVSTDGKHWWEYVDPTVTLELLDELTHEFLQILEKTPSRLKRIRNWKAGGQTPKAKPKVQEEGEQRDAMISMISMVSSESTVAGLMSLSAPSGSSSSGDKERVTPGSAQTWSGKGASAA